MAEKKKKAHYINNKEFSLAVVDYVTSANEAKAKDKPVPMVTNYIATCFLKISEGLSHRPNFVRYTYREEMVMDAVENCLRAIKNWFYPIIDIAVSNLRNNLSIQSVRK